MARPSQLRTLVPAVALAAALASPALAEAKTVKGSLSGGGTYTCSATKVSKAKADVRCTYRDTSQDGIGTYVQWLSVRDRDLDGFWGRLTPNARSRGRTSTYAGRVGTNNFMDGVKFRMCADYRNKRDRCGRASVVHF